MGTTVDFTQFTTKKNPTANVSGEAVDFRKFASSPEALAGDDGEHEGFFNYLGNLTSYVSDLTQHWDPNNPAAQFVLGHPSKYIKYSWDTLKQVNANVDATGKRFSDWLTNSSWGDFTKDVLTAPVKIAKIAGGSALEGLSNPSNIATGAVKLFVETPIEALTATKNQNGLAVTSSPEIEAEKVQSLIGTALMGAASSATARIVGGAADGEAALAFMRKSAPGRLARNFGVAAASGAVGGATYSGIADLGQEDYGSRVIANSLGMMPIGGLLGMLEVKRQNTKTRAAAGEFLADRTNAQDLAAINGLVIDGKSTVKDIAARVDGIASSDDLTEALIRSRLDIGAGVVVSGVSEGKAMELEARLKPSDKLTSPAYTPSAEVKDILERARPNLFGVAGIATNFLDDFDKAAYLARNAGTPKASKTANKVMADLEVQTNLSRDDIKSHAKAVKEAIKNAHAEGRFRQLSQPEIDVLNDKVRQQGAEKLTGMSEGMQFKDNLNTTWTRVGDNITNGTQVYPVESDIAKLTAGRQQRELEPVAPVVDIPKQNFSPAEGRKGYQYYVHRSSKSGDVLITPVKFLPDVIDAFDKTGFLPNERVVDVNGKTTSVKDVLAAGNTLDNYRRIGNSLDSKAYTDKSVSAGLLNPENYVNKMYELFRQDWKVLDEEIQNKSNNITPQDASALQDQGPSFANAFYKFSAKMGITSKQDAQVLLEGFYNKIWGEIVKSKDPNVSLPAHEERLITEMHNLRDTYNEELGHKLYNAAITNGMYIVPEGAGIYSLKDIQTGKVLGKGNTLKDVFDLVQKSGQTKLPDIFGGDGGNTIPPTAVGINAQLPFNPRNGIGSRILDLFGATSLGKSLAPLQDFYKAVDSVHGTELSSKIVRPLQYSMNAVKTWALKNTKKLEGMYNDAATFASKNGMTDDELEHVSNYIESMSAPEIAKGLLHRPMNSFEISSAGSLAKLDVSQLIDYMYKVRQAAGKNDVGTPEFNAARTAIDATKTFPVEIIKGANDLFSGHNQSPEVFSTYAVLRLAKALESPDLALSRADYLARVNRAEPNIRTALVKKLAEKFDALYKEGADAFGIENKSRINGYVNHMKIKAASGYNPFTDQITDPRFAHEMTRMGYLANEQAIRDPIQLARSYILAGIRTRNIIPSELVGMPGKMTSMSDVIDNSLQSIKPLTANVPDPSAQAAIGNAIEEHINDVRGIPRNDTALGKAANSAFEKLGIPKDALKAVEVWTQIAYQGAKPGATIRDFVAGVTNLWSWYGTKFTIDVLKATADKEYLQFLTKRGAITEMKGIDLLLPGESLDVGMSRLSKQADIALKLSGQHWMYNRFSSAIYKATTDQASEVLNNLVRDKTTKAEAYDKLDIDSLSPETQKAFDNLVKSGKLELATDMLAKWRIKQAINQYGNFNNPQSWNGHIGRLLGQYGQWGVNQINTLGDAFLRGSVKKRFIRASRYAVAGVTLAQTGKALGLNMSNWMLSPAGLVNFGPIPSNVVETSEAMREALNTDPNISQQGWNTLKQMLPVKVNSDGDWGLNLAHQYIPYGLEAQNIVNGYNVLRDSGNPLLAGAQAIGIPVDKSQLK